MEGVKEEKVADDMVKKVIQADWNSRVFPITGNILFVNDEDNTFSLFLTWPPKVANSEITANLSCANEDYSIQSNDFQTGQVPKDYVPEKVSQAKFFELAKIKDTVFSGFCEDQSCKVISKGCIIRNP